MQISDPFTARVTPHFQLGEFALWVEARRFTAAHQLDTARELATFLEQLRSAIGGRPIAITSGHRPWAINRRVGGATNSEHLYSAPRVGAVDVSMDPEALAMAYRIADARWPYSLGDGRSEGFLHLGRRADGLRRRWGYPAG